MYTSIHSGNGKNLKFMFLERKGRMYVPPNILNKNGILESFYFLKFEVDL